MVLALLIVTKLLKQRLARALNAGAALYVSGQAESMDLGIARARGILNDGAALELLESYAAWSRQA